MISLDLWSNLAAEHDEAWYNRVHATPKKLGCERYAKPKKAICQADVRVIELTMLRHGHTSLMN